MKNRFLLFIISMFIATSGFGQTTVWNPAGNPTQPSDGLWSTDANWTNAVPVAAGMVVFNVADAMDCTLDEAATVTDIRLGQNGPGETLIVADGGSLTTTGGWSGIGSNDEATLIIETGGSVSLASHAWIGFEAGGDATILINGGTLTVGERTGLGWAGGVAYVEVSNGGQFINNQFNDSGIKDGSVLNIKDGTAIFNDVEALAALKADSAAGRLVAYSGGGSLIISGTNPVTVTAGVDVTAPEIASTYPVEGATDMPGAAAVQIEFSEVMDEASVEGAITTDIANPVYSWSGNTLSIQGDEMTALTEYSVTISTAATDINGIALGEEFTLSFTIVDPSAPPTVVTTTPAHDAVDVEIAPTISVVFSKAMDSASVIDNLSIPNMVTVDTAWSNAYKTLTITCDNLEWETAYTFTIGAGSEGADATATAADTTFGFTTVAQPLTTAVWNPATDGSSDGLWTTDANWNINETIDGNYKVVFNVPDVPAAVLDAEVNINQIVMGDGNLGDTLIIANGGNLTTRNEVWSAIGYDTTATLIVEEGGNLTINNHMWVGLRGTGDANIHVNGGTINVPTGMFGLDFEMAGSKDTLFLNSGDVNLDRIHPSQSVGANCLIVIKDGILKINGNHTTAMNDYIANGKIVNGHDVGGLYVGHGGEIDTTYIYVDKEAPTVVEVAPADASTDIAVDSIITITFSEPMHRANTEGAITVSPELAGMYFSWLGTNLEVAGDAMEPGTAYTVTIGTGATDVSGNALEAEYAFGFTTYADVDPSGISSISAQTANIYPNPATDVVYLKDNVVGNISIYTTSGQLVLSKENTSVINVQELVSGSYIIKVESNESIAINSLLIK